MPTKDEIAASKARLMQSLLAEQGIKNPETVTNITPVAAAKKSEQEGLVGAILAGSKAAAAANAPAPADLPLSDAVASSLAPLAGVTPQDARINAPSSMENIDNTMRVTAGPLGDAVAGVAKGIGQGDLTAIPEAIRQEAQKTSKARMMMALKTGSEMLPNMLETTGQIGSAIALPGAAFATPGRALLSGAGMGVVSTAIDKMREGEPLLERPVDYAISAGTSGVTGVGGYYLGKMGTSLLSKLGVGDKTLSEAAERLMNENKKVVDESLKAMDDSGVMVSKRGLNELQKKITKDLGGPINSKYNYPHSQAAFNEVIKTVKAGEPVNLRTLNDLKERILRDAVFDSSGLAKDTAVLKDMEGITQIGKSIDDFMKNLNIKRTLLQAGTGKNIGDGLKAWGTMKDFNDRLFRTERIMTLITTAEAKAGSAKISFENALQNEFLKFYTKNKSQISKWFTKEEQEAIQKIATGDISKRFFNRLTRWSGDSFASPGVRFAQSLYGSLFESHESKIAAEKLITKTAGKIFRNKVVPEIGGKVGAATGGSLLK